MLHTKFQGNRPCCSGKCFGSFTIHGHGGHFDHVTWTKYTNFISLLLGGCVCNLIEIGPVVKVQKSFEKFNGRR